MRQVWKTVSLGDLCEVEGGDAAPQNEECFAGGTIPFVRMKDLGRYHFTNNLDKTEDKLTAEAIGRNRMKLFDPGCILFPRSGSVALNHRAILGVRACIVSHIGVLGSFSATIAASYLYRFLQTFDMTSLSKKTTGVDSIAFSDVKRIKVPVPPLSEQERIVRILDAAEELRRLRAQADRRTADLIPALFYDMFGDPATNPKGFRKDRLGNLLEVKSGTFLPAKNMAKGGTFAVYGGNGVSGYHDEYMFEQPVIVVGRVGVYCGAVHLTHPRSWVTDNALYVANVSPDLDQMYLVTSLVTADLNQYAGRAAQPLISGSRLYPVPVLVPPLAVQRQFAARVAEIRALEARQAESRRRLDELFQSLLHRAFHGKL